MCLIATSPEHGTLTTNLPTIDLLPKEHQQLQNQQIENSAHWEMGTSSKELNYDLIEVTSQTRLIESKYDTADHYHPLFLAISNLYHHQ